MMKYLFIVFIFNSFNSFCQSFNERQADTFIEIARVDSLKNLKSISLENLEFLEQMTDGGGELKGYFYNNKLVKIIAKVYLSNGLETNEYYFKSSQLFYVRETFELYEYSESLRTFNDEKTELNFIGEYVFKNNQIIDLESLGHYKIEDQKIDLEKTIISQIMSYQNMILNAKKKQLQ